MKLHQVKANRRTAEYRISNFEGWKRCALSFYNRQNTFIRRSMLDVRCSTFISFFFRSDWTLAASGCARMKQFKIWRWFYPGPLCLCRLGCAYAKLCWVSLHSTQPTFCRYYCEMRNPTTADFGTEPQKFLFRLIGPSFGPATSPV